jgi:hypothetical protein
MLRDYRVVSPSEGCAACAATVGPHHLTCGVLDLAVSFLSTGAYLDVDSCSFLFLLTQIRYCICEPASSSLDWETSHKPHQRHTGKWSHCHPRPSQGSITTSSLSPSPPRSGSLFEKFGGEIEHLKLSFLDSPHVYYCCAEAQLTKFDSTKHHEVTPRSTWCRTCRNTYNESGHQERILIRFTCAHEV